MNKINRIFASVFILSTSLLFAQTPTWTVNPGDYSSQANLTAFVKLNGVRIGNANDLLAALKDEVIRGVVSPILINGEYVFFLSIYSNSINETIELKYYDSEANVTRKTIVDFSFTPGKISGSAASPTELNVYENYDWTPILSGIPEQTIENGDSFSDFDLLDYTTTNDDDDINFQVSKTTNLNVSIINSVVNVVPFSSNWEGTEQLIFTVVDFTTAKLSSSDTVDFTIIPQDLPPILNSVPEQVVFRDQQFPAFSLTDYLDNQDDDDIVWNHRLIVETKTEVSPDWSFNNSGFTDQMNLVVKIIARNSEINSDSHLLAAFVGDEIRGIATPTEVSGNQLFYLTLHSNTINETISFQFYDDTMNETLPVMETVKFVANSIKGSAANPFILRAGRLIVDIDSNSEVSIARLDTAWYGTEDIQFWVEENTVKKLSDTTSTFLQVLENVLPVELNSFTGRVINNKVELNWETITELNNYGFWVERKLETADWAKLGFIEGVGNSNSPKLYKFIDSSPIAGKAYYRLKQIDFDGKFEYSSIIEVNVASPTKFELLQNYPNPFNPTTTIKFTIPASVMLNSFQHLENKTPKPASSADKQDRGDNLLTTLNVYNALGEKVAELVNEQKPAGTYEVTFNAENLSSGTYFYQLRAGELVQTKKLILIK